MRNTILDASFVFGDLRIGTHFELARGDRRTLHFIQDYKISSAGFVQQKQNELIGNLNCTTAADLLRLEF